MPTRGYKRARVDEGSTDQKQGVDSSQVDILTRLKRARKLAKKASRASPDDAALASAYASAKLAYEGFKAKNGKRRKPASSGVKPFADGVDEVWTCEISNATFSVRADGRARDQHLAGKNHKKRQAQAEAAAATGAPLSAERPTG